MDSRENPNYYFDSFRYKSKYICTDCRKSFKRKILADLTGDKELDEKDAKCPDCGGLTAWIGPKFRAPKTENTKAWNSIKVLRDMGLIHFFGWANNSVEIPESTKALKDYLKDLKANYEWNIKKRISSEYAPDNKDLIKHFSENIKKIDEFIKTK